MATLDLAMPYLKENEGEWSFTPGDKGGPTYIGIARSEHPEWAGWARIDILNLPIHDSQACNAILKKDLIIQSLVNQFYIKDYWGYDGIHDQDVATKIFDGAVNMEGDGHHGSAILALQKAILTQFPHIINLDGHYGPNTEVMVNHCNSDILLKELANQYVIHYNAILDAHPEFEEFRKDWISRAKKLPTDTKV